MGVFTIGCSNHSGDKFINLLKMNSINCLVDVRSTPFSKYTVQFNKENLQKTLKENNIMYISMAKEFGARRYKEELYGEDGYLDFDKVKVDDDFLLGVKRIKEGISKGYNICLMCTEKDPIDCHRTILVAKGLDENRVEVKHILDDGDICDKAQIDKRLLDVYFENRNQITFDMLLGSALTEDELIIEAYKKRNKEIGYEGGEL